MGRRGAGTLYVFCCTFLFFFETSNTFFRPQIAMMMVSLTGKQCRERFINHLDPNMKRTPWSREEDAVIRDKFPSLGTKWSKYLPYLPDRSDNAIKNRYHVISRYEIHPITCWSMSNDKSGVKVGGTKRSQREATASVATSSDATSSEATLSEATATSHVATVTEDRIYMATEADHTRLQRLHSARDLLDQRIRELEESGSCLSGASSPWNGSTAFYEEAVMSELGPEFSDFDFLYNGSEQTFLCEQGHMRESSVHLEGDLDCYGDYEE